MNSRSSALTNWHPSWNELLERERGRDTPWSLVSKLLYTKGWAHPGAASGNEQAVCTLRQRHARLKAARRAPHSQLQTDTAPGGRAAAANLKAAADAYMERYNLEAKGGANSSVLANIGVYGGSRSVATKVLNDHITKKASTAGGRKRTRDESATA